MSACESAAHAHCDQAPLQDRVVLRQTLTPTRHSTSGSLRFSIISTTMPVPHPVKISSTTKKMALDEKPSESIQSDVENDIERPTFGYLTDKQILAGVTALKDYIKKSKALKLSCAQRKSLLEAGENDAAGLGKVIVEVVFKNIPSNSKTFIHNVHLPNHWRLKLEPEHCNIALFVKHIKPKTEAQQIQFNKDRELDIENTHNYYKELLQEKLDDDIRSRISRIITTKELATEFNTFKSLDKLSKTYDFFISDKPLMSNKLNALPRRLGRRFWVREKKIPISVNLSANNLQDKMFRALSTESFYVLGSSATEKLQIGIISQSDEQLAENLRIFLNRLYSIYDDNVRYVRLRTNWGVPLPLFADLSSQCPKNKRKRRIKLKPVVGQFDLVSDESKVTVYPDGDVKIARQKRKK